MVRRGTVAALCAAALVLVGCSDDPPKPKPLDPPTSTPTGAENTPPTTTDSPDTETPTARVEPTMPAAAKQLTEPGAKAFVKYYYAIINYAWNTGDVGELSSLSEEQCKTCWGYIAQLEKVYGAGGRYETKGDTPDRITAGPRHTAEQPDFIMRVRQAPGLQFDEAGSIVERLKPFTRTMRITLVKKFKGWRVLALGEIR